MKLPQIGSNLWSEGCLGGLWVRFWRAGIEHESLYAKLPNRKVLLMRLSKASCIWSLNISHLPSTGRKKNHSFALCWHGIVHVGHKLLEWTLDLLSAACPLIKTGDKLDCQNWVIFIHKSKQNAVPSTSHMTYQNDHLNLLAMPDRRQTRKPLTSDTHHCCMCLPRPLQDRHSYHSGKESFANIRFG